VTGRSYEEARGFERAVRRFASSGPGSWLFARVAHHLDRVVYRATKGRHMASSLVSGLPVVFVTTTGARSGVQRTVPLVALPTADGLAIFGSWYGNPKHPAWRHNLRANPEGSVEVGGERWAFRAEEVEGERRRRIWSEALLSYPGYATYEKRAAPRRISVFILNPQPS
jgi:deazaflavin-dependent oxidoreductase (nitroreductase family)